MLQYISLLVVNRIIQLQKEIGEESARAFQSAAASEDPLAALTLALMGM